MGSEVCEHHLLMTGCDCLILREVARMLPLIMLNQAFLKENPSSSCIKCT